MPTDEWLGEFSEVINEWMGETEFEWFPGVIQKSLGDSLTLAEYNVNKFVTPRSDVLQTSDQFYSYLNYGITFTISDTLILSEISPRKAQFHRSIPETLSLADARVGKIRISENEILSLIGLISNISHYRSQLSLSDIVSLTEKRIGKIDIIKTENFFLSDVIPKFAIAEYIYMKPKLITLPTEPEGSFYYEHLELKKGQT